MSNLLLISSVSLRVCMLRVSRLATLSLLSLPRIAFSTARPATCAMSTVKKAMTEVDGNCVTEVDAEFPGTAVARLRAVHARVANLVTTPHVFNEDWSKVRRRLLWAGGLKDLTSSRPGRGYTGHAFNDWNHCDLTTMRGDEADNENGDKVRGIHRQNRLGEGIRIASLSELGPGGSWSTCMMGCHEEPPADVAHLQFASRIAFKLVWVPPNFETFVLVDDAGALMVSGTPTGDLPPLQQRQWNYKAVGNGRYSRAVHEMAKQMKAGGDERQRVSVGER
jgi:hypothetical protein